ncbi:histidine phosphatase family protein [Pedobacter paludis]|uniref:Histidine phosphatase family protein n=1 Tax=Pedobacter paludis TaxID=2203212 RepID=A0A317EXI4_9SPHI|nr:histidine phosphatase family protein [Pedobacter paludis]PWS31524.1 histidine phosphatase family protein [Pedobacter paludis]
MLKVYLLRHGETAYNADGNRYCGRTDIELTTKGLRQAKFVFEQLRDTKIDEVYASPLFRAKRTAEIASGERKVITDERLIEIDFGSWEGKTREEFIAEDASLWENWSNEPEKFKAGGSGESGAEIIDRLNSFYDEMISKHNGKTILVVGHNGVNRLFMAGRLGMPLNNYRQLAQENSSITLLEFDEAGVMTLKLLNSKI